jgi:hypothetical protein
VRSLLGRSVLAAVGGIVLAIVVAGAGVDLLASRDLHRTLDRSLRQRAVEISQLSASAPALLTRAGALDTTLGGTQLRVEVLDRRNRLVARSLALGGRVLPARRLAAQAIASGRGAYATTSAGGRDTGTAAWYEASVQRTRTRTSDGDTGAAGLPNGDACEPAER